MSALRLADYDYALPPGHIAQHPLPERDGARLLVLDRSGARAHRVLRDLPGLLRPGDLCSLGLLGSKLLPEVISAMLSRYMALSTPTN